jgi:sulfhydrogenase subunit alpha
MTTNARSKTITVDALARVEGEGGLTVQVRGGKVTDVKLRIYEPPRFFEAFLRGRDFREVPDITARICGICPVAYQMSSIHAMSAARCARCAGSSTAASGSSRTRCTSTCSTPRTSSATRAPSTWRPTTPTS